MEEAEDADRAKAGFFGRLESRRRDWVLRMLRRAHVLKGAENVDWNTFAGTGKALLDGRRHPHLAVCLAEDEPGAGERETATRGALRVCAVQRLDEVRVGVSSLLCARQV